LHDILITNEYKKLPQLIDFIKNIRFTTDVFISSHPYFFNLIKEYANNKIKVYEAHNVDYLLKRSYFPALETNKYDSKYLQIVKNIEKLACEESDLVMAVSDYDAEQLVKLYEFNNSKIVIVPNGLIIDRFKFFKKSKQGDIGKKKVVFIGSAHAPNIEAIEFIINKLAPEDLSIEYTIIGNVKEHFAKVRDLPKNICFCGLINNDEKNRLFMESDLALNPVFSGSGTNIKVLEYAALGIPVISTSFGMRGLDFLKKSVFIAEKECFFKEIQNFFLTDSKIIYEKVLKARQICEQKFSSEAIVKDVVNRISALDTSSGVVKLPGKKLIAVEGRILHRNISGTERYIFHLLKNISNFSNQDYSYCLVGSHKVANLHFNKGISSIAEIQPNNEIDLYHRTYQFNHIRELLEILFANRSVFTFHDLILCKYPEYFNNDDEYQNFMSYMKMGLMFSDRIIAISEHAKKDVMSMFNVPDNKIDVIYHGIDMGKFKWIRDEKALLNFRKKYDLPGKYILYLGTDYPHKNLKNLLIAFSLLLKESGFADTYLVLAGNSYTRDKGKYLKEYIIPVKKNVINIGYINDDEISLLYNASNLFVFPSLHEGFGFPVLEAFSCGVPVICSNATSLPEIAGDAAYMVDATDPKQISEAMKIVLEDSHLRKNLVQKGLKRVSEFTWERCARETLGTYEKALDSKPLSINVKSEEFKLLLEKLSGGL